MPGKKPTLILGSALLLAVLAWAGMRMSAPTDPQADTEIGTHSVDASPETSVVLPPNTVDAPTAGEAKRRNTELRVLNMMADPSEDIPQNTRIPDPQDWKSLLQQSITQAINGDLAAATAALDLVYACRNVPQTEEDLESDVQRAWAHNQRMRERNSPELIKQVFVQQRGFLGLGPFSAMFDFNSENETRRYYRGLVESCQSIRAQTGSDLLDDLEALAASGDVNARYLFAVMRPDFPAGPGQFDQAFHWQNKARDFSYQNLVEGEPAGYLAFGHSYQQGLFTKRSGTYGQAFYLAAQNCGFPNRFAESALEQMVSMLERAEGPDANERSAEYAQRNVENILTALDDLMLYCQ